MVEGNCSGAMLNFRGVIYIHGFTKAVASCGQLKARDNAQSLRFHDSEVYHLFSTDCLQRIRVVMLKCSLSGSIPKP